MTSCIDLMLFAVKL